MAERDGNFGPEDSHLKDPEKKSSKGLKKELCKFFKKKKKGDSKNIQGTEQHGKDVDISSQKGEKEEKEKKEKEEEEKKEKEEGEKKEKEERKGEEEGKKEKEGGDKENVKEDIQKKTMEGDKKKILKEKDKLWSEMNELWSSSTKDMREKFWNKMKEDNSTPISEAYNSWKDKLEQKRSELDNIFTSNITVQEMKDKSNQLIQNLKLEFEKTFNDAISKSEESKKLSKKKKK